MKLQNYDVLCSTKNKGLQTGLKQIIADSPEEAFKKFLVGKEPNKFELVVVSGSGFWDFIKSPESFPNPLFRPDEIKSIPSKNGAYIDYEAGNSDLDLDLLNSGNINTNSDIKSAGRKQYKVMTQKDKWFSQKIDPERLEQALNAYAREGWVVKSICTASIAGFGQNREELIVIFER